MSNPSRRAFLTGIGASVGAASLAASEAVTERAPQARGIVHLPTGLLVSVEDEAERTAARRALVGVFGEQRVLEMEALRFPVPRMDELLWVSCDDSNQQDIEDVRDVLEGLLGPETGNVLVSNFQGGVETLSQAELMDLKRAIETLLADRPLVG